MQHYPFVSHATHVGSAVVTLPAIVSAEVSRVSSETALAITT
jgi:hypothetical protein